MRVLKCLEKNENNFWRISGVFAGKTKKMKYFSQKSLDILQFQPHNNRAFKLRTFPTYEIQRNRKTKQNLSEYSQHC